MNFKKEQKAFTLVEVLVSMSLFVMAIIVLSQVYISVIRSERIAYALLSSENNIRNSLEVMARSIRVGKNFEILAGNKELCFDYYLEGAWERYCYRFNVDDYILEKSSKGGSYMSMFDPSLKVNYAQFYNKGGLSDSQSVIIIILEVSISVRQQEYLFNLQTAVTPRHLGEEI